MEHVHRTQRVREGCTDFCPFSTSAATLQDRSKSVPEDWGTLGKKKFFFKKNCIEKAKPQ